MKEAIIGFVGVIIGAFIGTIIPLLQQLYFDYRTRKRNAQYLAIRTVCILEKFIDDCVDIVSDDGTDRGRPAGNAGTTYDPQVICPKTINYPDDVDWKCIDSRLMYQLLSLPNEIEIANRQILFAEESNSGPPDYIEVFEERYLQYAQLGLKALSLENEIRNKYGIPLKVKNKWSNTAGEVFRKGLKKVDDIQEGRRKSNEAFFRLFSGEKNNDK